MNNHRSTLFKSITLLSPLLVGAQVFAHEGHGNSAHHAFLHFLEDPLHLLWIVGVAAALLVGWQCVRGKQK